ncbi:MAG: 50S ribosomal protein L30 [Candidatus Nanoarchaeia archaeon]|nr:50S ribosomal protein L30 [Candidatus Nanoarchaeia archaeon]MDD5239650.1 50S ribosomal protein L30 [Candidatus Nanoarchaeia archaeon]
MIFAVIRLKGMIHVRKGVFKTMKMLRLNRKHHCILVPANSPNVGMITKIKNCVTWGEIDHETLALLLKKRGRMSGNQRFTEEYLKQSSGKTIEQVSKEIVELKLKIKDVPGLKPVFRLRPPSHGFETKGMSAEFSMGGSFGYRGKEINELLKRMI